MQMRGGGMWQNLKIPRNFNFSIWNEFEFVAKFANYSLFFEVFEIKDFFHFYSGFNTAKRIPERLGRRLYHFFVKIR